MRHHGVAPLEQSALATVPGCLPASLLQRGDAQCWAREKAVRHLCLLVSGLRSAMLDPQWVPVLVWLLL